MNVIQKESHARASCASLPKGLQNKRLAHPLFKKYFPNLGCKKTQVSGQENAYAHAQEKSTLQESPAKDPDSTKSIFLLNQNVLNQQNLPVIATKRAASLTNEEIKRLIKKLAVEFFAHKNQSSFRIKEGLFANTCFFLTKHNSSLRLTISNASSQAQHAMNAHEHELATHLRRRNIHLESMTFVY